MKKRFLILSTALTLFLTVYSNLFVFQVRAISINDTSVFLNQEVDGDKTCTLTSCLNMFRRRAIIDGRTDWIDITHSNYKSTITTNGKDVKWTINDVKEMNAGCEFLSSNKKSVILSRFANHPEGIVLYCPSNPMHSVLLTGYDSATDTLYCYDPLNSYPNYPIPLTSTMLGGSTQDSALSKITQIWYITNKLGGVDPGADTEPPENVSIWSDKTVYSSSESITLYWNAAKGATNYYVYMWKDGVELYGTSMGSTTSFTSAPTSPGNYTFIVRAGNSAGYNDGASYCFTVTDNIQSKPYDEWIASDKQVIDINEYVTFTFDAVNAVDFWLGIDKGENRIKTVSSDGKRYYTTSFSEIGEYKVYVSCSNEYGGVDTKQTSVYVCDRYIDDNDFFYGKLFNKTAWKPVRSTNDYIELTDEKGFADEMWKFVKQREDNSYEIISCQDGKNLYIDNRKVVVGETNNDNAKRWYIYEYNNSLVLKPKEYKDCLCINTDISAVYLDSFINHTSQLLYIYRGDDIQVTNPKVDCLEYQDHILIKWSSVCSVAMYKVKVYNENGQLLFVDDVDKTVTEYRLQLQNGKYKIKVLAYNYFVGCESENVSIDLNNPPFIECSVKNNNNLYSVSIKLFNIATGHIIVAGYKGNKLVSIQSNDYSENFEPVILTGNIDTVKVMVWDNTPTMMPLAKSKEIPSMNFQ